MSSLPQILPDIELLLALEPEELAPYVLVASKAQRQNGNVILNNFVNALFSYPSHPSSYQDNRKRNEITLAVTEAWNWLEVQGLLVPAADTNGSYGWKTFSRKAERMVQATDVNRFVASRKLAKEKLHHRMADLVWSAFIRADFDVAVFQAMKAVEVYVREASKLPANLLGTKLMREAFEPKGGPLTDMLAELSEREARAHLFAGAIGSYKNSQSHRDVNLQDPDEAYEVVMLANHLMKIIDQRKS